MPNANKPIVFVFGAKKGDADARKKNLSAINTQVAYRAHERRREKKSRQRTQAKDDEKVDRATSTSNINNNVTAVSRQPALPVSNIEFSHFIPPTTVSSSSTPALVTSQSTQSTQIVLPRSDLPTAGKPLTQSRRPRADRHESDLVSDTSSDHDGIWSASPASNRYSTPGTDLSAVSPLNGSLDKALDPFFRLPTVASDREKWLVHFCKSCTIFRDTLLTKKTSEKWATLVSALIRIHCFAQIETGYRPMYQQNHSVFNGY